MHEFHPLLARFLFQRCLLVDEPVEKSPVEDGGYVINNEDLGCTMTNASQPSRFQTIMSLPQQIVVVTTVSDTSAQKLIEMFLRYKRKGFF